MKKQVLGVTFLLTCLVLTGCKPGRAVQTALSSSLPAVSASSELSESSEPSSLAAISGSEPPCKEPVSSSSISKPASRVPASGTVSRESRLSSCVSSRKPAAASSHKSGVKPITITFQGKKYTGNFTEASPYNSNAYTYESANGCIITMNHKTGQLWSFASSYQSDSKTTISKKEAIKIGVQLIQEQCRLSQIKCDLTQYTLDEITNHGMYQIIYSKHLYGYKTKQNITIDIERDGVIRCFIYVPDIFDNIKLPTKFDETPYLTVLNAQIKRQHLENCTITDSVLYADSGELCMDYWLGSMGFCVSQSKVLSCYVMD